MEKALDELKQRIAAARKDFKAAYKISAAVAFGDFLGTAHAFKPSTSAWNSPNANLKAKKSCPLPKAKLALRFSSNCGGKTLR